MGRLWNIRLFGGLDARRGDLLIDRFESRPTAALLAILAYHIGQPQPREVLIETLWPGVSPAKGRHRLSQALSSLRRQLEPADVAAGAVFAADRFTVTLRAETASTDLEAFDSAARDPVRQFEAIELYRGPLLQGFYEDWIVEQQIRYEDRLCDVVLRAARLAAERGEFGLGIDLLRRGLSVHALREDLHRTLLELYLCDGQRAAAGQHAAELKHLWRRELQEPLPPSLARSVDALQDSHPESTAAARSLGRPAAVRLSGMATVVAVDDQPPAAGPSTAGGQLGSHVVDGCLTAAFGRLSTALEWLSERLDAGATARAAVVIGETDPAEPASEVALQRRALALFAAARPGQVLADEAAAALVASQGGLSRELGQFRLSEGESPRHLFALGLGGRSPLATPPQATRVMPGAVPQPPSRFFGREAQLSEVCALMRSGARLLTLLGPGGTGKTRLAIETALHLEDAFVGGIWFVDLSAVTDAGNLPTAILSALRVPRTPGLTALDQVGEFLAHRRCLLVLDNLEQIVDRAAELLAGLLRTAPDWACLATSRSPLEIAAERRYPLLPLPVPAESQEVAALLGEPTIQLFCDRARAVRPSFELTTANAAAVAEICRRLEGIPLAIELAAARIQKLGPESLLQQLADRFDVLVTRRRDAVARQRTLRAAIDWSYDLLSPAEQRLLADLATFRGTFDATAVRAVCGLHNPAPGLDELVRSSLLLAPDTLPAETFRLLETVREYASERLSNKRASALRSAHLTYYLTLAEEASTAIHGPAQVLWGQRLESASANFAAAIETSLNEPGLLELGLRLAGALSWPWYTAGRWHEGRPLVERLLKTDEGSPETRAAAYLTAGLLAWGAGDYGSATAMVESGLACLDSLPGAERLTAELTNLAGLLAWRSGDCGGAIALFDEAEATAERAGDTTIWAAARHNLGLVHYETAAYVAAGECFRIALERRESQGDLRGQAISLTGLGEVALEHDDPAAANALLSRALALYRDLDQRWGVANVLSDLAFVAMRQRRFAEAQELIDEAGQIMACIGHRWGLADATSDQAQIAFECGQFELAVTLYEDSARQYLQIGDQPCVAAALEGLGMALVRCGRYEAAVISLGCAERIRHLIDTPRRRHHTRDLERYVGLLRQALDASRADDLWEHGRSLEATALLDHLVGER